MDEGVAFSAAVFVLVVVAYGSLASFNSMKSTLAPWYGPVVTEDEVTLAQWADVNIPHNTLFAADLFGCEMLTATARAICTVGGAWELADNPNQRFYDNERSFLANSSEESWQLFRQYNVTYVMTAPRTMFYGYGYKQPDNAKFSDTKYFTLVKSIGVANLYAVRQPQ